MNKQYDILIVGAGLSSAVISAKLKHKYDICVIDILPHIGGLCYDYKSKSSYIHEYGPHIFHTSNNDVISFISQYSKFSHYTYKVESEISFNNNIIRVPFPYSKETITHIGRELSEEEIIKLFFDPYSKKMWGKKYNELPNFIRNRVPKKVGKKSYYFSDKFQVIPKFGYSNMINNMFDGVEIILNADPDQWKSINAKTIIYCGRIDLIDVKKYKIILPYFTSDIKHNIEPHKEKISAINSCLYETSYIRKTYQRNFYPNSSDSDIVTYETPAKVTIDNKNPFYPYSTIKNINIYNHLKKEILKDYPNIVFMGRSGIYQYLDMNTAIEKAMELSKSF